MGLRRDLLSVADEGEDQVERSNSEKKQAAFDQGCRPPLFIMDFGDDVRGGDIDEKPDGERE